MKFLCPQCKAKYQIADEKIEGRTLRMKCRRCEHEIVVKGDLAIAESEPPPPNNQPVQPAAKAPIAVRPTPAARPAAGPSVGARRPVGAALAAPASAPASRSPAPRGAGSALGADFRRQMSAGAAEPARSATATPLDAWHVAIHEVPVGPMKREELARKIAAGAVTGESLCWREGFDDWRPLRDVAELSPLLRRPTNPPPVARPTPPMGRVAPAAGRPVPAARPGAVPVRSSGPSAGQRPAAGAISGARAAAPAARSNVVPIGGRLGAAAAPAFEEEQEDDFDEATVVAQSPLDAERLRASAPDTAALGALVASSPPPTAAATPAFEAPVFAPPSSPPAHVAYSEPPRRRKKAMSPIVWIAIAGAGTFGMTLAAMVGTKLFQQPPAPAVAIVAPPLATPTQNGAPQAPIEIPDEVVAPTTPDEVAAPAGTGAHTPTKRGGGAQAAGGGGRQLTAAQQAELDRMAGGSSAATNLTPPPRNSGGSDGPAAPAAELSAAQLRAVVLRNRPGLQHCYEMAARQTGSSETMRANVEIAVGGSGVVTRVSATGPTAPAQLTTCLEGAVRRWHFPAGGEAAFPVVFSPGG